MANENKEVLLRPDMVVAETPKDIKPGPNAVDITPNKDGGIMKEIKLEGKGSPDDTPWKGDKVCVHYTGTLTNGSKFDSSRDRNEKFTFNIGKSEVIKGWDIGIATMKVGEEAVFHIKSEYGYGDTGSPPKIPPKATLIFEVKLYDFHGEDVTMDQDEGIMKRIKSEGKGYEKPNDGSTVEITIKGVCDGAVFDERNVKFEIGDGASVDIPDGLETALQKMKKNEAAQVILKSRYGFGKEGNVKLGVPGDYTLTYDVTLNNFEKMKEAYQLDANEKIEHAKMFKEKGTKFFKNNKFQQAAAQYQKVVDYLSDSDDSDNEDMKNDEKGDEEEKDNLLRAGRLNLSMCYLKLGRWMEARDACTKVIEKKNDVAKAWFRRGEAYFALNDFELAKVDFEKTIKLEPDNKAAKNKLVRCQQGLKAEKDRQKKMFGNIFERMSRLEEKEKRAGIADAGEIDEKEAKAMEVEEETKEEASVDTSS